MVGTVILTLLFIGVALGPIGPGIQRAPESNSLQRVHSIGLLLFAYSNDHDGHYPDGRSSTEVFQKLLDEKYVEDPTVFYLPLEGKTEPVAGQKLKPENVSFDVTGGLDQDSSDLLPVVFLTDYKVSYTPDGTAVPLVKPFPRFGVVKPGFWAWPTIQYFGDGGIAVAYKGNNSVFLKLETSANAGAVVPRFVSPEFKPDDKVYRQLTPDGVLPP